MKTTPRVREWMSPPKHTLQPGDDMTLGIEVLADKGHPAIPVVDEENRLVGMLTEKDCLRTYCRWVTEALTGGHVADHMSPIKMEITAEMDLLAAASVFLQNHFPCLPVQEGGKLVGVIHRLEVLRGIAEWQRRVVEDRTEHERAAKRPLSVEDMQRVVGSHTKEQVVERFHKE